MILLLSVILFRLFTNCATLTIDPFYLFSNQTTNFLTSNALIDEVIAESRTECAVLCGIHGDCEAFRFASSVLQCVTMRYSSSIVSPLVFGIGGIFEAEIFIRSDAHVWVPSTNYIYHGALNFWYRVVLERQDNITGANDVCRTEGANLLLIKNQADYDFAINIQAANGIRRVYLQGERQSENDDYLDDLGRVMTFFVWDIDGAGGSGNYLKLNSDSEMETTPGEIIGNYICQILQE